MRSHAGVLVLALLSAACVSAGSGVRNAAMGSFRVSGVGAKADPTIRPARVLPESVDESAPNYGSEADGGLRLIAAGLRLVSSPKGALLASDDRFSQAPTSTIVLPERLGGGFLFVIGKNIWRAEQWLEPAKPIFVSPAAIQDVVAGLDRVYVRSQNTVDAIDGRTGRALDIGPWPASPHVTSYAAADGWRAAAVADLRGVIATFDAGATWRTLDVAMDPKRIVATSDSIAVGGLESGDVESWYELRADGSVARLGSAPRDLSTKAPFRLFSGTGSATGLRPSTPRPTGIPSSPTKERPAAAVDADKDDGPAKLFGRRPLAAAIEDGWPLSDGSAVVARDGALARIGLGDGALLELVRDAFPLKSARCHPVPLPANKAPAAFGFVCGEPRGATVLYAYDPARGRLAEMKRFDKPRVVASSGNGALSVRGPCAEDGDPPAPRRPEPARLEPLKDGAQGAQGAQSALKDARPGEIDLRGAIAESTRVPAKEPPPNGDKEDKADKKDVRPPVEVHPYCILGRDGTWSEIHVRGDAESERVVALSDGRTVVLSPPQGPDSPARITVLDKGRATTLPVAFPRVAADVARVLRLGLWLDGFEERRPGVLGGWIEAGGAMLGVEIALDGKATPGQFVRDAGMPFVSGKYGLGWSRSRRGYETTDGGMTWKNVDLPEPLVPSGKVERRACGPIGCLANGWLRVGWGTGAEATPPSFPPPLGIGTARPAAAQVQLACEPLASLPPAPAASRTPKAGAATSRNVITLNGPPVLGSFNGLRQLEAFGSQAAPALHDSERGLSIDINELTDHFPKTGLGRVYGWGPATGDWDTLGHWQIKWLSPFSGWNEVRSSLATLPPSLIVDLTRGGGGSSYYWKASRNSFVFTPGDDSRSALLQGNRGSRSDTTLYELEADRAPIEIKRTDGEPFGELDGAVRTAGRWFVVTSSRAPSPTTVVWQIEGGIARELVRVPRTFDVPQTSQARLRLARRSDGRAIGIVVDGDHSAERTTSIRWVLPISLDSGAAGEPEAIGYSDLAGRTLEACSVDDAVGWEFDVPLGAMPVQLRLPRGSGTLGSVLGRLRFTPSRACIDTLAGAYADDSPERRAELARASGSTVRASAPRPGELSVIARSGATQFPLRCSVTR